MRRIVLIVYNLLLVPAILLLLPGYLSRIRKRGGYGRKFPQRFGIFDPETLTRIGTGRIWIHAVSVGETGIALKFAKEYRQRNPGSRFLISTTTSTGLAILEKQASEWLEPIANPVDLPIVTASLIRRFAPSAVIMVEADLWPNRIAAAKGLGIPVILLNARLSRRSEERYRRMRFLTAPLFNQLDLITLTDGEDPARWHSMGVEAPILHLTGNIKYDSQDHSSDARNDSRDTPLLLAASTHAGEEAIIAGAWRSARVTHPSLRLMIAPRHAERRREVKDSLRALGIECALRSEGAELADTPLLLDTTGELSGWYARASVVFVGKSLPSSVNKGGQNMIEPLQAGVPVLIGPHTSNFEPLASRLVKAGAAARITDADEIAVEVCRILDHPEAGGKMVRAAAEVLATHRGATQRNCELVEGILGAQSPEAPQVR